jgi:hypothetical protein
LHFSWWYYFSFVLLSPIAASDHYSLHFLLTLLTKSFSMSSPKPMFVSMLRDGFVMTYRDDESDKIRVGHAGDRGDNDKWILETGEEPNTVALKCVANGKYLTGERKHYGKVSLRDEKEWWEIYRETDRNWPPGSFALCMVGSPENCLCVSESSKFSVGRAGWRIEMYVIRRRVSCSHHLR